MKISFLEGHYTAGAFVFISGFTRQLQLATGLCKLFEDTLRHNGPQGRNSGKNDGSTITLTLHEAFFLLHALGCLSIEYQTKKIGIEDCWKVFRKYHATFNIKTDFAIEYSVYLYFRSRGWIVKTGENYGTNFLLYTDGLVINHAKYAVLIMPEQDHTFESLFSYESLMTFYRVIQSVSKELLLVRVKNAEGSEANFDEVTSISNLRITTQIFNSQPTLFD